MAVIERVYPEERWARREPAALGFDPEKLEAAGRWLAERADGRPYRVVVVRHGYLAAEWADGVAADERLPMASAAKSLYSCMLGIAIAEGVIGSADDRVMASYPEMMNVPEGCGPKPGRFARKKDRAITFRQLISNTSGYLKPGEEPGKVFHYQTFGMNILCHALATRYGYYDSRDPERLPGFGQLLEEKIRDPIGGTWTWGYTNFDLPPRARIHIFGNYTQIYATAYDMARMGWLWLNWGRWGDRQVVPEAWLREAVRVAPDIRSHAPEEKWTYGYAFWTNEYGRLWPSLPRDSYAASGAGSKHIWVCPSLDLVVAQSPGLWRDQEENDAGVLRLILDACRS